MESMAKDKTENYMIFMKTCHCIQYGAERLVSKVFQGTLLGKKAKLALGRDAKLLWSKITGVCVF